LVTQKKKNNKQEKEKQAYFYNPYLARMIPPFGDKIDFSNIHLRSTGSPISLIDLAKLEHSKSQQQYELQQQQIQSAIPFYPIPSYPLSPDPYLFVRDPLRSKLMPAFIEKVNFQDQLSRLKHVDQTDSSFLPDGLESLIPNNLDLDLSLNLEGDVPIDMVPNNVVVTDPYELFQLNGISSYLNESEIMEIYTQ